MEYRFGVWQLSDIAWTGPDPFVSRGAANGAAVGATSFTIGGAAALQSLTISDDESTFASDDSDQHFANATVFDGVAFGAGPPCEVRAEYSYVVRRAGSVDPAQTTIIYVVMVDGAAHGITSAAPLITGQAYDIIAIDSNAVVVPYSALAVCFAAGTMIATARGMVPVQDLRVGMRVQTVDNGLQRLRWIGRQRMSGLGAETPIEIAAGVLGNARALTVSRQHRLVLRPEGGPLAQQEILVPAKALLTRAGVRNAPRPSVLWYHFMFSRHEIVLAEGALAESFLPGPEAMRSLGGAAAQGLMRMLKGLPEADIPARIIVPPGRMDRLRARWGGRALGLGGGPIR